MRKFFFGALLASMTATMPSLALGGDREIAQAVMAQLQQHKAEGSLKGFDLDLKVEDGVVYLNGSVSSPAQKRLVEQAASSAAGAKELVSELQLKGQTAQTRKSTSAKSSVVPASTTEAPAKPSRNDMAITDSVISMLQQSKQSGVLRGFELDVSTVGGDCWLRGLVANQEQKDLVLDQVRRVRGVSRVIDDITVAHNGVRQASTGELMLTAIPTPLPVAQGSSMPVMNGSNGMGPRAFAPSGLAGYVEGGAPGGHPVAMQGGQTYGAGAPRYDQPNLPSYAWPSYAAYPNYAAVTYPKQYSPSAWPYIGPFYPYPQVPLGWRKVALEWDDGLWYLDFTSK